MKHILPIIIWLTLALAPAQDPMIDEFKETSEAFTRVIQSLSRLTVKQSEQLAPLRTSVREARYELDALKSAVNSLTERIDQLESRPPPLLPTPDPVFDSWSKVSAALLVDQDVEITSPIDVTGSGTFSTGSLTFRERGRLQTNGHRLHFDCPIINPADRWIFRGYKIDETYPARWNRGGTTITGAFGGDNRRDPRWWGLQVSPAGARNESWLVADQNNDAIAAASMSARYQNATDSQITVIMPPGEVAVRRPIRLDGIRCQLAGQGAGASQVVAGGTHFEFLTDHHILTEDYPVHGSTPVIEIGYEQQPGRNPDQGFAGGVRDLAISCPAKQPHRRVSGIMWESALQEHTVLQNITIKNYGGYGIGGPRHQTNSHNGPRRAHYTQLNMVSMSGLWLMAANKPDAIGMSVHGRSFRVSDVTLDHGRNNRFGGMIAPAIITGSTQAGSWTNIHIEQSPAANTVGIGIHSPGDGRAQRLDFRSIHYLPSAPSFGPRTRFRTLLLEGRGSYTATNITQGGSPSLYGGAACIEDMLTKRVSAGYHDSARNGTAVAMYARQETASKVEVTSSDRAMEVAR